MSPGGPPRGPGGPDPDDEADHRPHRRGSGRSPAENPHPPHPPADHAQARDAVFADVNPAVLEETQLFSVQTLCQDKNTYVTRPDLGRHLSPEAVETLRERCVKNPDVQIYAADGLSTTAIEANLPKILPVITQSLEKMGLTVGTPFYLRFGRVGSEEHVAEVGSQGGVRSHWGAARLGHRREHVRLHRLQRPHRHAESKRTVVSNIHKNGTAAVEAGAYVAEVIAKILEQKASGVDLVK